MDAAASEHTTIIGAVLESKGCVLLEVTAEGELRVPAVGRNGGGASISQLEHFFARRALEVSLDLVYSVFEDRGGGVSIYYRGRVSGAPPEEMKYVPLSESRLVAHG